MGEKPKRVSDIIGCPYPPVLEVAVADVLGEEFLIKEYTIREGRFGSEAHILCEIEDKEFCLRTTSEVVMGDLELIKEYLPLVASVAKPGRYYKLQ